MRKIPSIIVLFLLPLIAAVVLSAQRPHPLQEIYVFGDSLSDTGRVYQLSNGLYPPSPPYFQGRYSNGSVWVEYLAQNLSVSRVNNFAYGGATTAGRSMNDSMSNGSNRSSLSNAVPGLLAQVQTFAQSQSSRSVNAEALYVLWAGANDYLQGLADVTLPVNHITQAIATLTDLGAEKILVVNLPDLGQLPITRNRPNAPQLTRLTESHNLNLQRSLQSLNRSPARLQIVLLDAYQLYQQAIAEPSKFGFLNVTQPCLLDSQTCSNPDQFLFWDSIHPTTTGHRLLAESALAALGQNF